MSVCLFLSTWLALSFSSFESVSGLNAEPSGILSAFALHSDERPKEKDATDASVTVRCRGRLRHGVVAMGGETTGTTITFHRTIWELNLPDDAMQQLASRMNKEDVIVTGSLRRVIATEDSVRWIVDVEKLSPPGPQDGEEPGAEITVKGTLRAALSLTGNTPDLSVRTDDQVWHLDFGTEKRMMTSAEPMIGKPVLLSGRVVPLPDDVKVQTEKPSAPRRHIIRVRRLESPVR